MPTTRLDTDYLILGAGAMGMAFADVILAEDPDADIVIADRHATPGGHWNDSYPFVRLHQPAAFYGLNSTPLGNGGSDLASGPEITAYYQRAMDRFLATGRVRFLPMSEHLGDGRIASVLEQDRVTHVTAHRRTVDSTYMGVQVPAVTPPRYAVDPDATVVPPNRLAELTRPRERYVVVGAGKTGIDAILFLLDKGVAPERIQWIMPNDAWLWDRATVQPGRVLDTFTTQLRSIAASDCVDDVFFRLERHGIVSRVDTGVLPTKWRCATVNRAELAALRQVTDIVRLGRVQRVGTHEVVLDAGTVRTSPGSLFVDCTSDGLAKHTPRPVFSPDRITLQSLFMCQQVFSAAITAHLELQRLSDDKRNRICSAVPHPEHAADLPTTLLASIQNLITWNQHVPLWLRRSRLNPAHEEPPGRYLVGATRITLLHAKAVKAMNQMDLAPRATLTPKEIQPNDPLPPDATTLPEATGKSLAGRS